MPYAVLMKKKINVPITLSFYHNRIVNRRKLSVNSCQTYGTPPFSKLTLQTDNLQSNTTPPWISKNADFHRGFPLLSILTEFHFKTYLMFDHNCDACWTTGYFNDLIYLLIKNDVSPFIRKQGNVSTKWCLTRTLIAISYCNNA